MKLLAFFVFYCYRRKATDTPVVKKEENNVILF